MERGTSTRAHLPPAGTGCGGHRLWRRTHGSLMPEVRRGEPDHPSRPPASPSMCPRWCVSKHLLSLDGMGPKQTSAPRGHCPQDPAWGRWPMGEAQRRGRQRQLVWPQPPCHWEAIGWGNEIKALPGPLYSCTLGCLCMNLAERGAEAASSRQGSLPAGDRSHGTPRPAAVAQGALPPTLCVKHPHSP